MAKVPFLLSVSFLFISVVSLAFSQTTATARVDLPLAFEPNRGQTAPQVNYLARSREGTVFLTKDGVSVAVAGTGSFRVRFEGASASGGSIPEQRLASRSNYLDGRRQISRVEKKFDIIFFGCCASGWKNPG